MLIKKNLLKKCFSSLKKPNFYEVLQVNPQASCQEIRESYLKLGLCSINFFKN